MFYRINVNLFIPVEEGGSHAPNTCVSGFSYRIFSNPSKSCEDKNIGYDCQWIEMFGFVVGSDYSTSNLSSKSPNVRLMIQNHMRIEIFV